MKAIIIDDIQAAVDALASDVADYCPQLELVGFANSVVSGAKLIKEQKPELIFLDIEMDDGDGFDLLDIIGEHRAHVIFTTGSKEYAIKAFKYEAVDYLLKPIDPDDLIAAVARVKVPIKASEQTKIALHTAEEIYYAEIESIIYCRASGNYTQFVFDDRKKILVTKTLKEFEKALPPDIFVRTHQSYLVNINHVKSFLKEDGGYLLVSNQDRIPVSVRKKTLVMQHINQRL